MKFNHEKLLDKTDITYEEFYTTYKLASAVQTFPFEDSPDPLSIVTPEAHDHLRIKDTAPSKIKILATLITPIEILTSCERDIEMSISLKNYLLPKT